MAAYDHLIIMVIFLDLGCYKGETTDEFLSGKIFHPELAKECSVVQAFDLVEYPEWEQVKAKYPNVSIAFNQKAVGISDGVATFGAWPENPQAQTCYPECTNFAGRPVNPVERMDFVGWLQRFAQPSNTIICKMDIEGAEYEILEQLINTGAIRFIKYLYVEFHNWIFPPSYELREKWIRAHCPLEIGGWG